MNHTHSEAAAKPPFDMAKLDRLMGEADLDVLVATSRHNVQYLLGGYRFFFFDAMDAIGVSRYLPVVVYQRGRPENTLYVGNRMEGFERELGTIPAPIVKTSCWGTLDATETAVQHIKQLGDGVRRVGIEPSFLPADGRQLLGAQLSNVELLDGQFVLERLRAIKTAAEIELVRQASARVVSAMQATFKACEPGMSKHDVVDRLRKEEQARDLTFEYCLITAGTSRNRAPSNQRLERGDVMSLDSGGNFHGYIGDLCRMGILGQPDAELEDLLAEVETVQQAAFSKIRAGTIGGDMIAHAEGVLKASKVAAYTDFFAHGMGLI